MTPELLARHEIDRQLAACGWTVQDRKRMNIYAQPGVAVREFQLPSGAVDYALYADGKVNGTVEAKPEGHGSLSGVEVQSTKYVTALPPGIPAHRLPLPFHYEATGTVTQFTNLLDPAPRSRPVFAFHRPEELLRLVGLDRQLRSSLADMPPLADEKLWRVQAEAVTNLEKSLAQNRPRSLVQMATGSGKTFTAISAVYRLVKYGGARRVLFLVDRTNLGRQTFREFQQYTSPATGRAFTEEYNVQHLTKNALDPVCRVCITTIQRLYSMLRGEAEFDERNEEGSLYETGGPAKEVAAVAYNPKFPVEAFDFIVADECHRSIYNLWRQVLDYFDAFLVGLTATPTKQTIGFFANNLVMEYGHEQAVADGVNVGFDVYRIRTKITEEGATIEAEPGLFVPRRDRRTRKDRYEALDDDLTYNGTQLDRDVVNPDQIRLVVRTFRDRLFTEIFPGRKEVPKTLIFAKDDNHAEDITRVVREEFGRGGDFCQKITYRTTGKKPEDLLAEFRNSFNPRVAVSVDMIATGTDVKPLECLVFLRNVKSAGYFEQMKGRGARIASRDEIQSVGGEDAPAKTHFVIVDAVGVCEQDKTESKPLDRQPSVPLDKLLNNVAVGMAGPDLASTLAARLTRLDRQLTDAQRAELAGLAGGRAVPDLAAGLLTSLDPDAQAARAAEKYGLPPVSSRPRSSWTRCRTR
ncbi:MAG: DEAD/DEAH box helicase family protein [Gemmataceae bacterium]|nr:DEAD/DEAH box helicase family protein [Gemmataceae bacterium]